MAGSTQVGNTIVNHKFTYQSPPRDGISHGTSEGDARIVLWNYLNHPWL